MTLGERIKDLRVARGWKQVELAKAIGIKPPSLSLIEKGHTKSLKAKTILRLAEVFGVDPRWLETGRGPMVKASASDGEAEVLSLARSLSKENQQVLIAVGRTLLTTQKPSVENPFPTAKAKSKA